MMLGKNNNNKDMAGASLHSENHAFFNSLFFALSDGSLCEQFLTQVVPSRHDWNHYWLGCKASKQTNKTEIPHSLANTQRLF